MDEKNRKALYREVELWQGDVDSLPAFSHLCQANRDEESGCETCIICLTTGQIQCYGTPIDNFCFDSDGYFSRSAADVRGFLGALQHGGEDAGREFLKAWEAKNGD